MRSWRDWSWADGNFWDSGVQPLQDLRTTQEITLQLPTVQANNTPGPWITAPLALAFVGPRSLGDFSCVSPPSPKLPSATKSCALGSAAHKSPDRQQPGAKTDDHPDSSEICDRLNWDFHQFFRVDEQHLAVDALHATAQTRLTPQIQMAARACVFAFVLCIFRVRRRCQ